MRNLMPITRPMGAAELTTAAEDWAKLALAFSDLSRAVAAYEAATGQSIEVSDYDPDARAARAGQFFKRFVGADQPITVGIDPEAQQDAELLDAMYPSPIPESGTVDDAVKAGVEAVADLVSEPVPPSNVQKMHNALPTWQGEAIPADLRDAVQHLSLIGTSGTKWGFDQDLEMIERAIEGQTEKLIADLMEFSPSFIRQRFNTLVDRTHGAGNRFDRQQVRDALRWMTRKDEMPAF